MEHTIRLLVVDDEARFLATLSRRLGLRGFDVTMAGDGATALQAARDHVFDVALVDLKMPGMDGEQVLRLLQQNDPHTQVIILTGHGSIESAERCTRAGSYRYLQKPCETDRLVAILQEAAGRCEAHREQIRERQAAELQRRARPGSPRVILDGLRGRD